MEKFQVSKEYGSWVTTLLTFFLTLSYYSYLEKSILELLIFWIPVFLGLMLFDSQFKNFNAIEISMAILAMAFAAYSLIFNLFFIFPYLLFTISYFLRQKKKNNALVTLSGLSGQSLMFYFSLTFVHFQAIILSLLIFLYLYGAEFGIKSFLKKNFIYSIYNFIPIRL